jgi:hypothetical protein
MKLIIRIKPHNIDLDLFLSEINFKLGLKIFYKIEDYIMLPNKF